MRVVITGATGNIGSSLVEALGRDPEVREVVGPGLSYLGAGVRCGRGRRRGELVVASSGRPRRELGWEPRTSALEALLEVLGGIRRGDGVDQPPLDGGQRRVG